MIKIKYEEPLENKTKSQLDNRVNWLFLRLKEGEINVSDSLDFPNNDYILKRIFKMMQRDGLYAETTYFRDVRKGIVKALQHVNQKQNEQKKN